MGSFWAILSVLLLPALVAGGDIVHRDDNSPNIPGCSNDFVLVIPFLINCLSLFSSVGFSG